MAEKPINKTDMLIKDVADLRAHLTSLRAEVQMLRTAIEDLNKDECFLFDWQGIYKKIPIEEVREQMTSDELIRIVNHSSQDRPMDLKQARITRQFFLTNFRVDIWDFRKE
jgi:cell division protein FtsB